jgi:hypothetical protein
MDILGISVRNGQNVLDKEQNSKDWAQREDISNLQDFTHFSLIFAL